MTITEIKNLTKYLSEKDVNDIKEEIKSKETIIKSGNLGEEETMTVLNTLFAILVIEKALESEIEEVEGIRSELEEQLLEAYKIYDAYIERSKKDKKEKKKRRWLLHLLGLSEDIKNKKKDIGSSSKALNEMKEEVDKLKREKSDDRLKNTMKKCCHDKEHLNDFIDKCVQNMEEGAKIFDDHITEYGHKRGPEPRKERPRVERKSLDGSPSRRKSVDTEDVVIKHGPKI